jgi:hypothetical protein
MRHGREFPSSVVRQNKRVTKFPEMGFHTYPAPTLKRTELRTTQWREEGERNNSGIKLLLLVLLLVEHLGENSLPRRLVVNRVVARVPLSEFR